jgi:hypothetical protein
VKAARAAAVILLCAGCTGGPLPIERGALERELLARARATWSSLPSLRAEGDALLEGEERLSLTWRVEARRGEWAQLSAWSALDSDPVLIAHARAGAGLRVRIKPPGGTAKVYAAATAELAPDAGLPLEALDRGELPLPGSLDLAEVAVVGPALLLHFARGANVADLTVRRSDGFPTGIEARVRGAPGEGCLVARFRPDATLPFAAASLTVPAELRGAVVSCCDGRQVASLRLRLRRVSTEPFEAAPAWPEPSRPLSKLAEESWAVRADKRAIALRQRLADACSEHP